MVEQLRAVGHRVDVALDGALVAVAVLAEQLRDSAAEALAEFRRLGLPVEVLTGDTAQRAASLNLPARTGLLPADKRAAVEEAKATGGKPLFVGDGINDASALAAAHAGIALAGGTDVAVAAADVTLYHADLRVLPWAIELSREAVRAVRRNLCRALCYNLIGMTLAACGLLHPVAAAVLMVLSSLSLVFSSTRIGVCPDHCGPATDPAPAETGPTRPLTAHHSPPTAWFHGFAFAIQGVMFLLLLAPAPPAAVVLGGFALAGFALAYLWHRWASIPHALDMCFGMLTLGNLGMLLGWWADNDFAPLRDHGCSACVAAMRDGVTHAPWMWVGMLVFANAAMLWLPRRSGKHGRRHAVAMYTGGNVGMVLGMVAGGWCATQFETGSVPLAVAEGFAGMTVGMLAGMLLGTWVAERLMSAARVLRFLPRWFRTGSVTHTAG